MSRAQGWIQAEELQFPADSEILVGLVVTANPASKFARISIRQGTAGAPRFDVSGRLFRFGCDTAVYFHAPAAGCYTVFVQCLERHGWGHVTGRTFNIPERPICQQINIRAESGQDEVLDHAAGKTTAIPFWVR
jgi:hypothetical protein